MVGMTGVARSPLRDQRRLAFVDNIEEGPLAGETALIFHMKFEAHHSAALKVPGLVDGALGLGSARLENHQSLVRPCTGGKESAIRLGIDEDIIERGHIR